MTFQKAVFALLWSVLIAGSVRAQEATPEATATAEEFVFGLVLVGPENDRGWSQAHYEAGLYMEAQIPGARMIFYPSLNSAFSPDATLTGVVTQMVDEGAQLIFTTSDVFEDDTDDVAALFPEVTFISVSGDNVLRGISPSNVGNVMAQIEWGKLIAGCAAGLATQTGNIGYLGALINTDTRRFASSAYLGARYCYEHYRGGDPDALTFTVTWIGFWFNIPGVTLDPSEETAAFFNAGSDVVISGIDTSEALTVAAARAEAGESVFAIPFDYSGACDSAPDVCLGVPYYNWGPSYTAIARRVMDGTWERAWNWVAPDWTDLNNPDTSSVGFTLGAGLSDENRAQLEAFTDDLSGYGSNPFVPQSMALWRGPLRLQNGDTLAPEGQLVDLLDIWYLPQLLDGMVGASE